MNRPVRVLTGVGAALGGVAAVGWHRQLGPFSRLWPPAWVKVPPGVPHYSGVVPADAVSAWSTLWWPAVVVLPLLGAALGWLLGTLLGVLPGATTARRHTALSTGVAVAMLGVLVGVAGALAWHVDPGVGIGWIGGLHEEVDLGYPAIGLGLGVLAAATVHLSGAATPRNPRQRPRSSSERRR